MTTPPQMPNADAFLMGGGGAPSASFPTPGTKVGGTITEPPTVQQQRDLDGKPKFWSDGNPQMQLVITIQTEQRDPGNPDDDGRRRLFVKGQLKNAVAEAVRAAGAPGLQVGGTLDVAYTHDGVPSQRGFSAPKQYAARYTQAAVSLLNSGATQGAPVADPWATQAPPAAATPPAAPAQQALHAQQQAAAGAATDVPF